MIVTIEGELGVIIPISFDMYNTLSFLQQELTESLMQPAKLNPDNFR